MAFQGFKATKGGTDQTGISSGVTTAVTFGTEVYDVGGFFASNKWTPPAGNISLLAAADFTGTLNAAGGVAFFIYKNNALFTGINWEPASGEGTISIVASDAANGTDVYEVRIQITTSSGTATVSGSDTLTWFSGYVLPANAAVGATASANQTNVADVTPTQVTYDTEQFDIGAHFASNAWTPPAGVVALNASNGGISGTLAAGVEQVISILKNGSVIATQSRPSYTNGSGVAIAYLDLANGTDVYTVKVTINVSSGTSTLHTPYSIFGGEFISTAAAAVTFRKTLSVVGTRVGSRQIHKG